MNGKRVDRRLIGRYAERKQLEQAIAAARHRHSTLLLLAGEAGVGKTRLAEEVLAESGLRTLRGAATLEAPLPYGPLVAALRSYLRSVPAGLSVCGPLLPYLALLLPELGEAPEGGDRSTLFEAIRCALAAIAAHEPYVLFLDDLHRADSTTLELLPNLIAAIKEEPILLLCAYRSDEISRGHPLRYMRTELRRRGLFGELVLEPLVPAETSALAASVLGHEVSEDFASLLYDRTQGIPFFIEEMTQALAAEGRLLFSDSTSGVQLAPSSDVPIPETVKDAILLRASSLSEEARHTLDVAAVIGLRFDPAILLELVSSDQGLEELLELSWLIEAEPGAAGFRHALLREALYGQLTWTRRRILHRQVAAALEDRRLPPAIVAEHWLAGRELERARQAFAAASEASCMVHAYRDAVHFARQALDLWSEGADGAEQLRLLERLGNCAELSGDLPQAAQVWREVAENHRSTGGLRRAAEIERRLAGVYELQAAWERAVATRLAAAETFRSLGLLSDAAAEHLAASGHLQGAGSFTSALDLASLARQEAQSAGRTDLEVRALAMEGLIRAKLGQVEVGVETVRSALAVALQENLTGPATEIYQRLAVALEHASDYRAAHDTYMDAHGYCEARGASGMAQVCLACLAVILRQRGEWERAVALCQDVVSSVASPLAARAVAAGIMGLIHALRGDVKRARPLLLDANTIALRNEVAGLRIVSIWGLALLAEKEGKDDSTAEWCSSILSFLEQTEERHYVIPALHWAVSYYSSRGMAPEVNACAHALARISAAAGTSEALASLAHALGEVSFADSDFERASVQFSHGLELLRQLKLPFEHAQTQGRYGSALIALGERKSGIEQLTGAYHTARALGAKPYATRLAHDLAELGERVERRVGRQSVSQANDSGLSRRELEVLRLLAVGHTNREIGQHLFLSLRTVDMHVRNILSKLDCRSRAEAAHKAREINLLPQQT